jgi:hypothetical protein
MEPNRFGYVAGMPYATYADPGYNENARNAMRVQITVVAAHENFRVTYLQSTLRLLRSLVLQPPP